MFYYDDCDDDGRKVGGAGGLWDFGRFAMFKHKKMNVSGRFSVCNNNNNDSSPEL